MSRSSESTKSFTASAADSKPTGTTIETKDEDRWTHNISYLQLVASSSVGLVQFWRHPNMLPVRGGWPGVIVYAVLYAVLGYPMHYLELAIGMVTRKSVLKCWDFSPVGRGIGWAMLIICAHTAFSLSIVCAYCLGLFVHSFHSFLPWLHCAAKTDVACTGRQVALKSGSETPAVSFFHNQILHMNRKGINNGLGKILWELSVYYLISWVTIYFVAMKGIYSYSKLVLLKALLGFFVLFVGVVAVLMLKGSFKVTFGPSKWGVLREAEIYRVTAEQILMELAVSQGTLIMLGSYNNESRRLSLTSFASTLAAKLVTLTSVVVLSGVDGALTDDFSGERSGSGAAAGAKRSMTCAATAKCPGTPLVLWADLAARTAGSQFWSAVIFFTFFLLGVATVGLLMQTILSNVRGKSVDKVKWIVVLLTCSFFCLVGVVTLCTEGGIYILGFLDFWPVAMPRLPVAALTAAIVTYVYGQKSFCEDVYFAVEEYPNVFLRVCWAVNPIILMAIFLVGGTVCTPPVVYDRKFPSDVVAVGLGLVLFTLLPVVVLLILYLIFRWRIRNIVGNEK